MHRPASPGGGFDLTCKLAQSALVNGKLLTKPMRVIYMPGGVGAVAYNAVVAQRPADAGTRRFIALDDLHALAGLPQTPVFSFGFREILFQRIQAIFIRQHQLPGQVFNQWVLLDADFGHWPRVVHGGGQQVQVRDN